MRIEVIGHNPLLKKPLLAILETCAEAGESDRAFVEEKAQGLWSEAYRLSPASCVDVLVRAGALIEVVLVNGSPYEGTLEDLQLDPNVADDAVVKSELRISEDGRELMEAYAPEVTLRSLMDERPQHAPVFETVLSACSAEGGCSREALEHAIEAVLPEEAKSETGNKRVYPQYYLDALETAGGIVWDGSWRTTTAGAAILRD